MLKQTIPILLCFLLPNVILAQSYECGKPKYSESTELYEQALELVEDSSFNKATVVLKKITKKDTAFAEAWYLLGKLYHEKAIISQYDMYMSSNTSYYFRKSEDCFTRTLDLCKAIDDYLGYFYVGENMYFNKEYAVASFFLKEFKKHNDTKEVAIKKANEYLYNCAKWAEWQDSVNVADYRILKHVTTPKDEFESYVEAGGTYIIYKNKSKRLPSITMQNTPTDEWVYSYVDGVDSSGNFTYSPKFHKVGIPDDSECYAVMPFANSTRVYLTVEPKMDNGQKDPNSVDIFVAKFYNKYLSGYERVEGVCTPVAFEGYPSITGDEKTMVFVSNREDGVGGLDLYVTNKGDDGKWATPVNMGEVLNTVNDECYPFISKDGNHLFFGSNGHFGLGGYDMFVSHKQEDGLWSKPVNLGKPINSYNDDKNISLDRRENIAYFARRYLKANGGSDIYITSVKKYLKGQSKAIITGQVLDHNNKVLEDVKMSVVDLASNKEVEVDYDIYYGRYSVLIPKKEGKYLFRISKEGYSFTDNIFESEASVSSYYKTINMFPIKVGAKFELSGIEFETKSNKVTESSQLIIADFAGFMKDNPGLKVMIHGRMETIDDLKTRLSESRAKSIKASLVSEGIEEERLKHQGFSSSTHKTHSYIEFEIIGVD